MVGFGSSLRMARRPGWEKAYLDYETLKLLLSQIEAVYEEEGHREAANADVFLTESERKDHPSSKPKRDYRDELFLESDSDEAYLSVDNGNDTMSSDDLESAKRAPVTASSKPFNLSYSHEASSSDESVVENGCAPVSASLSSWTTWDKTSGKEPVEKLPKGKPKKPWRSAVSSPTPDEDSFYSLHNSRTETNAFFLSAHEEDSPTDQRFSVLNAPVRRTFNERTSLLTSSSSLHPPKTPGNSLTSFSQGSGTLTPPSSYYLPLDNSISHPVSMTKNAITSSPPAMPALKENMGADSVRLVERRDRRTRKRKLRAIRRNKERKVPRHLRVAHAKARAITERFLGLVRAETEKVMLFAQSRLGELADTAGSLRFPSFDDENYANAMSSHNEDLRATASYDYPLSDSGMHPSASSSEDGTGGGQGFFPWSDSSDEDEESHTSQRQKSVANKSLPKVFSGAVASEKTLRRTNRKSTPTVAIRKDLSKSMSQELENIKIVQRQINHFAELRQGRPIFQRNDHILGEDMLFLSAVEEADGYTSVGVELIHVLRFICVNLIAIRKICRKHDRLLMNRMLGGYYQRTRAKPGAHGAYVRVEETHTLGGLVARTGTDNHDTHPVFGRKSHFKLVGYYDLMIQHLANSRTVQVVSSCLAGALSEYEVTRSRADALNKLNSSAPQRTPRRSGTREGTIMTTQIDVSDDMLQPVLDDSDHEDNAPSTASSISLTRLRYTVTSIFSLREAARYKLDNFGTFISRSQLTFSGQPVVGEGLDGCSRATLDFLVSFDPNAALLLDSDRLYRGLRNGKWMGMPLSQVMVSTLAVAKPPSLLSPKTRTNQLNDERAVVYAVSVLPTVKSSLLERVQQVSFDPRFQEITSSANLSPLALWLNRMSCFLFSMNYFIAHATTIVFVRATGAPPAYSAVIIGAPNAGAIIGAIFQCWYVSFESSPFRYPEYDVNAFRFMFTISSFFGVFGNTVHGIGINLGSIPLAILGRFLLGFAAAEILNRQVAAYCVPAHVVKESGQLVRFRLAGMMTGLFLGSLAEAVPITIDEIGIRSLQVTSWLMVLLWIIQMARMATQFGEVDQTSLHGTKRNVNVSEDASDNEYSSDSSSLSEQTGTPQSMLYRSSSDVTSHEPFTATYGATAERNEEPKVTKEDEAFPNKFSSSGEASKKRRGLRQIKTFAGRIRKLLAFHIGLGISLILLMFVVFALEVFFTAAPMVTCRYFGWAGAKAGIFLGCLTLLVLPINYVTAFIARRYEERAVIARSLVIIAVGLFTSINWVSLFSLARSVPKLLTETEGAYSHPYDWKFGIFQYVVGMTCAFVGLISLQGSTLSLLSKVSPAGLRSMVVNVGTIVSVLSPLARCVGNFQIFMVGLSHKLIDTDIMNALIFPLFIASCVLILIVKRHFFYLM